MAALPEKLDPNPAREESASRRMIAAAWAGPLPTPDDLAAFNTIIPDGADRIMRMAEAEQAHRIAFEKAELDAIASDTRRGHYLGGFISLAAIGAAVCVTYLGAYWAVSVALVGVPILGIVQAIVRSKTTKTDDAD